ncbi:hypothetical protein SAMN05421759_10619 [Roseivivax lentus]|uniref:Lipoprotein n=1 Tax=Roseivivax lentus TaxID=633194 RepID=A0A1N7MX75_9RHOB|nr:DUF6778 family protein [Roseivivax lentus]SIS90703.1 hypothetical protein SAMN05421759_10619 [Roseivivax lentus]
MTILKRFVAIAALLGLTACSGMETASRNATGLGVQNGPDAALTVTPERLAPVTLVGYEIEVPQSLKVSEANAYIPRGDIVWRGEPRGDRYGQVKAIFDDSLRASATQLTEGVPVNVKIVVRRFHALTEKARYTTGGVHNIVFDVAIFHAVSGELLRPVKTVRADLKAYGGAAAIAADAAGQTQRVRITGHLAQTFLEELTAPAGHQNAQLGVIQAMNYAR